MSANSNDPGQNRTAAENKAIADAKNGLGPANTSNWSYESRIQYENTYNQQKK